MATYPAWVVEFAPGVAANEIPVDPDDWVDISDRVQSWSTKWGRESELDQPGAGTAELLLDNNDGEFDPDHTTGTYYGELVEGLWFRIKAGTTSADTDVFYGHVNADGFRLSATQFLDSWVSVSLVDDLELLAQTSLPESVWALEVTADEPRAWWRLGESSGTVATDSSGNGYHGTYSGGATFNSRAGLIAGSNDAAIEFTDAVSAALPRDALPGALPYTIEFWYQLTEDPASVGSQALLVFGDHSAAGGPYLTIDTAGVYDLLFTHRTPSAFPNGDIQIGANTDITDGEVHHVMFSVAAAEGDAFVAVDGVDVTDFVDYTGTGSLGWPAQAGTIGDLQASPSVHDAVFDELVIYDSALSAARAAAHYAAGAAPWASELTSARVTHLLDSIDFHANRNIDTGQSIVQLATLASDALSALLLTSQTENGLLYVDHQDGGKLRSVDRHERWTATASVTSQATFGDSGSEITYDAAELVDDRIINRSTMQRANGAAVTVTDGTTATRSFDESGLLYETDTESQYRAERLVAEKQDRQRVARSVTFRPRKSTHAAWPHVFARKVDDRVTVKWRPAYGGTRTFEAWIEGIAHRYDAESGLSTTFHLSPVPYSTTGAPYAVWGTSTWETGTSVFRWAY